jgi:hypothetical protein
VVFVVVVGSGRWELCLGVCGEETCGGGLQLVVLELPSGVLDHSWLLVGLVGLVGLAPLRKEYVL